MRVEIISIGDELLLAEIVDTNAAYIVRCLRELEVTLTGRVIVGDEQALIAMALHTGLERADLVICSGGLGVHSDDFTRQAVADMIDQFWRPASGKSRPLGSAPAARGLLVEAEEGTLLCLPGNQRDMSYLLQTEVLPYLQQRLPRDGEIGSVVLRTAGMMESKIRESLKAVRLQPGEQLTYTSYAGQSDIRIVVKAETEEQVRAGLARLTAVIENELGDNVYGRDRARLEREVVEKLKKHELHVAVAEYQTEGILSQIVQTVPNGNFIFTFTPLTGRESIGDYLELPALDAEKSLTAWSKSTAEKLRARAGSEKGLGLVIYKNVTAGGVQLLITLDTPHGISFIQRSFGGHPGNVNHWAATLGLVKLRQWLLAYYPE